MLTSLFGEFGPRRLPSDAPVPGAVASRVEEVDAAVDANPAASMRSHLAATRLDLGQASSMITLIDPARQWAGRVLRALSEAGGQVVERLNLRDRATLASLGVIERTRVAREAGEPLKVYQAESGSPAMAHPDDDLHHALAERSHLSAVILAGLSPHEITRLLRGLLTATRQPEWQCPWLLFILPAGASALRQRILEQDWPRDVHIAAMPESLTSPASVWNTVLTAWEAAAHAASQPSSIGPGDTPVGLIDAGSPPPPPQWLAKALASVARIDGVLGCGITDLHAGDLLAGDGADAVLADLRQLAPALCAARRAHLAAGGPGIPQPDEILVSMGGRQALLRNMARSDSLGFIALVDRLRANLPLMRHRLMDAERQP